MPAPSLPASPSPSPSHACSQASKGESGDDACEGRWRCMDGCEPPLTVIVPLEEEEEEEEEEGALHSPLSVTVPRGGAVRCR